MNSAAILRQLVRQVFRDKAVLLLPNTYWPGNETDLLVVESGLRVIDVEIKVSRADFKRDASKDKWWKNFPYALNKATGQYERRERERAQWPRTCWKHYFAMPEDIWAPELAEFLPSPASGVLAFRPTEQGAIWRCVRRAKPNRDAEVITGADAIDIARLAGLRMWDALAEVERSCDQLYEQTQAALTASEVEEF